MDKKVYTHVLVMYFLSTMKRSIRIAVEFFREHGGTMRTKQILELGIHPRTLYQMRDEGVIDHVSRVVYRLAELPPLAHPDLVTVSLRVPRAVVCLISALAFHDLTTEIPHEVQIALPRGTKSPRIAHPPIRVFRLSEPMMSEGVEHVHLDGVEVRIYEPDKTVADCFRFRNKIGLDVAVEALGLCLKRGRSTHAGLLRYARMGHVESVMKLYLEALQ